MKMLHGNFTLFIDQHGYKWTASTLNELRDKVGGGRVSKMYVDDKEGRTFHVGYVIGHHWMTAYAPIRIPR